METPSPSKPDLTLPLKLQFQSTNTSFLADFLRHINSRVPLSNNVEYKFILLFHSVSMVISHLPRASQIKPGFMERLGTVCVCADHKFASCNFFFYHHQPVLKHTDRLHGTRKTSLIGSYYFSSIIIFLLDQRSLLPTSDSPCLKETPRVLSNLTLLTMTCINLAPFHI